ncbi:transposase [Mesorhizobium sp. M0410]|uniref:transposase n=1 Tax=Mesorhizobium sp. M0410 TaxID=2956943 RepID=UPI00333AAF56
MEIDRVNQRIELVNALCAHLYEFGHIAVQGIGYVGRLAQVVEGENTHCRVWCARSVAPCLDQIDQLTDRLAALKKKIDALSRKAEASRRLQTMPGVGPIAALEIFAPPMENFKCGRDFAAWLGLVPLQKSTGGIRLYGIGCRL